VTTFLPAQRTVTAIPLEEGLGLMTGLEATGFWGMPTGEDLELIPSGRDGCSWKVSAFNGRERHVVMRYLPRVHADARGLGAFVPFVRHILDVARVDPARSC
jgi:hypothetical protein